MVAHVAHIEVGMYTEVFENRVEAARSNIDPGNRLP
jgi:hypothetical protein